MDPNRHHLMDLAQLHTHQNLNDQDLLHWWASRRVLNPQNRTDIWPNRANDKDIHGNPDR